MHRADPLARQRRVQHPPASRQLAPHDSMDEHAGLQLLVGIGDIHSDLYGTGLLVQHGVNLRDPPLEDLAGIAFCGELDLLPVTKPGDVRLVGVQIHPYLRQIGDRVDCCPLLHVRPLIRVSPDDDATRRRIDRHVIRRGTPSLDFLDLFIEQAPPAKFGLGELSGIQSQLVLQIRIGWVVVASAQQQLPLGHDQIGTVHGKQMVPFADGDVRVVNVQAIEAAGDPGRNIGQAGFVVVDLADHPHRLGHVLPFDGDGLNVGQGNRFLRHPQLTGTSVAVGILLKRNQRHEADRTLARLRQ